MPTVPTAAKLEAYVDRRLAVVSREYGVPNVADLLKTFFAAKLHSIQCVLQNNGNYAWTWSDHIFLQQWWDYHMGKLDHGQSEQMRVWESNCRAAEWLMHAIEDDLTISWRRVPMTFFGDSGAVNHCKRSQHRDDHPDEA